MKRVTMHQAKTHLSRLVVRALAGEEIIITRRKHPVVRLQVVAAPPSTRTIGLLPGLVQKMGPGFNDPYEDWDPSLVPPVKKAKRRGR